MYNTHFAELNKKTDTIKTYVGSDGKLHFTDASGADSVLHFSGFDDMNYYFLNTTLEGIKVTMPIAYPSNMTTDGFIKATNDVYTSPYQETITVPKSGTSYLWLISEVSNSIGTKANIASISGASYEELARMTNYDGSCFEIALFKIEAQNSSASVIYDANYYARKAGR